MRRSEESTDRLQPPQNSLLKQLAAAPFPSQHGPCGLQPLSTGSSSLWGHFF